MIKLKITNIRLKWASKYLFVFVDTDEGFTGIGEVGVWGFLPAAAEIINSFKSYLIGKDPFLIEDHWNFLYRSMYFRGSLILSALSAIDIALWDIKGKALNVPIYELLGGKTRNKIRCYEVTFAQKPDDVKKECKQLKKDGFTAVRLMMTGNINEPQLNREHSMVNHKLSEYARRVQACREAVGEDFDIILECHRSLSSSEALVFADMVKQYHPMFLEDPIAPDNDDALLSLARKINLPVAVGERNTSVQEFAMQLRSGDINYIRPDVCVVGGLTAGKKIAALAEGFNAEIVPHNPLGPVSTAACLQLAASIPNFSIQEFPSFYRRGNESQMLVHPFVITGGFMKVPDGPGLGIELVSDVEEKFPKKLRTINAQRAYDGSIVDV